LNKRCYELYERAKTNPKGLRFSELKALCEGIGMRCDRIAGSHFIFKMESPFFLLSIQKMRDGKAKPYQVRQLSDFIEDNRLDIKE
jgi:hypothetical protein